MSVWYGGCHAPDPDPPVDSGMIEMRGDADVTVDAGQDDAAPTPDALRDAAPPPDTPEQ